MLIATLKLLALFSLVFLTKGQKECRRYGFSTWAGRELQRSSFHVDGLTLRRCLQFCDTMAWCGGVQFDVTRRTCHIYYQIGFAVRDPCCVIARKQCIEEGPDQNTINGFQGTEQFPEIPDPRFGSTKEPEGRQAELDESQYKGFTTTPKQTTTTTTKPTTRRIFRTTTRPTTTVETTTPPTIGTTTTTETTTQPQTLETTTTPSAPSSTTPTTTPVQLFRSATTAAITLPPRVDNESSTFNLTDYLKSADPAVIALMHAYFGVRTPRPPPMTPEGRQGTEATSPPIVVYDLIPDSGNCPDPFEKVPGVFVNGGRLVSEAKTVEECKAACLMDDTCQGVDFHSQLMTCVYHDAQDMEGYQREPNALFDHYHKTQCEEHSCYSHDPIDLTFMTDPDVEDINQVNPPEGVEIVPCSGLCFVRESLALTDDATRISERTLTRGCLVDTTLKEGQDCQVQEDLDNNGEAFFELYCRCDTGRCNGLGPSPTYGLALYLPFDGDLLDHSGNLRHGHGKGVQFDSWAASKGRSLYLDGKGDVLVPSLGGYLPGVLTAFDRLSSLTLTFWFKRLPNGKERMTVLSNGMVEVTSQIDPNDDQLQIVTFSAILTDSIGYIVKAQANESDWLFVACRIIYADSEDEADLELFLHSPDEQVDIPQATLRIPALPVHQSIFPLYLGRDPLKNSYFTGLVDELMIFGDALSESQLQSVYDRTRKLDEPAASNSTATN